MLAVAATARHHRAPATLDQQIADWLQSLIPEGRPRRLARMSAPGELKPEIVRDDKTGRPIRDEHGKVIKTGRMVARDKYEDVYDKALTPAMLRRHAAGDVTYSYTLDQNGLARAGSSDIDQGGQPALLALLAAAHTLGYTAFAIHMPGEKHSGGHFWCLFDALYSAADIKALMQQIAALANVTTKEFWPGCNQGIRPPFGKHQLNGRCGELLTQAGEIFDLDVADQRAAALAAVQALPLNGAPPKAEPVSKPDRTRIENAGSANPQPYVKTHNAARRQGGRLDTKAIAAEVIAEYNRTHKLSDMLTRGPGGLHFCECGGHSSGLPKIAIWTGSDGVERAQSYSPDCKWFPQHRSGACIDPFSYYVLTEHGGDRGSALKVLNPIAPRRQRREDSPPPQAPAQRVQTVEQAADAERKREARRAAAAATIASVQARASQDAELSDSAQLVLLALLDVAGDRAWCRPSVARIAEMTTLCRRAVYYGLEELAEHGYIASSTAPGRTTVRTFLQVQGVIADCTPFAPGSIASTDLTLNRGACEGAPNPPRDEAEPDSLECWSWCDDAHGADDLTAALVELAPPAAAPLELQLDDAGYTFDEVAYADGRRAFLLRDALDQVICTCPTEHAVSWAIQCLELGVPLDQVLAKYASKPAAPIQTVKAGFDDSTAPELASFTPGAVFTAAPPAAVPEVIQLDPLVQAPPLESDAVRYGEFIWRWRASKPGSICKRTGKPWSQAQRDRFRAEYPAFLDDVSPAEAALRWAALDQPQPRKGARGRALTSSRAAGPPVDQQPALFSLPEVQPHDNRNPASNARPRALGANALYALG